MTGVLIIATVVTAWVVFREAPAHRAVAGERLFDRRGGERVLGGFVMANELAPWLVLVHLGLAMMILSSWSPPP